MQRALQGITAIKIMLLCNEEEVLWVFGVGISSKIGVKVEPTHVLEVI